MKEIKDLSLKTKVELEKLDLPEIQKELKSASKKMYDLTIKLELGELKQTHLIKFLRRYIAVLNTLANNKTI